MEEYDFSKNVEKFKMLEKLFKGLAAREDQHNLEIEDCIDVRQELNAEKTKYSRGDVYLFLTLIDHSRKG